MGRSLMAGEAGKVGTPPAHYATAGGLQPFDIIDAYEMTFFDGSVLKYLLRWDKKDDPLGDLMKARHYLQETIRRFQSGRIIVSRSIWGAPTWPEIADVLVAFGLSGHAARAVEHLLRWRFTGDPLDSLQAASRCIDRAIGELENTDG